MNSPGQECNQKSSVKHRRLKNYIHEMHFLFFALIVINCWKVTKIVLTLITKNYTWQAFVKLSNVCLDFSDYNA